MAITTAQLILLSLLASAILLAYFVIKAVYNVFFHPLRHYPGPLLAKASRLPWTYHARNGDLIRYIERLHAKYGDVVRVAPGELSFISAQAWQDIAGHRTASGRGNLPKDGRHRQPEYNGTTSVIWANDENHRRMRRIQAHMFSEKALVAQEPVLKRYIDKLVTKLHEHATKPETATVDIVRWHNYTTFDILGDLAFGDSFGGLESNALHPWIRNVFKGVKMAAIYGISMHYPSPISKFILASETMDLVHSQNGAMDFETRKARERLDRGSTDRVDFMSYILKHNDEKGMTMKEIEGNAALLILAGSETTATFLSGITFNLLRTPRVLKKLTDLIRTTFKSESDINMLTVQQLEYLTASIEEGFRTYPPVPTGLPRMTTKEGNIICDCYVPPYTAVYVSQWAAYKSPTNFADPENFVPERWSKNPPARYANDNKKVLQPFSIGPRNCIGRNLAYAELRLILARLLWNFDLELRTDGSDWMQQKAWTLWEKTPLLVKIIPRKM